MKICCNNHHAKKQINGKFFFWYTIIEINTAFSKEKKGLYITANRVLCGKRGEGCKSKKKRKKTDESSTEYYQ